MERICKVIEDALGNEVERDIGRNMGSKVRKLSVVIGSFIEYQFTHQRKGLSNYGVMS